MIDANIVLGCYMFVILLVAIIGFYASVHIAKYTMKGADKIAKNITNEKADKIAELAAQKVFDKISKK